MSDVRAIALGAIALLMAGCGAIGTTERPRFLLAVSGAQGVASKGGDLEWRAFEVRAGQVVCDRLRIDFVHANEGHARDDHRDGFALQPMFRFDLSDRLALEAGAGPYLSFDTTSKGAAPSRDEKRVGLLVSAAALWRLDDVEPGLHLRLGYQHAQVPGEIRTDAVLLGVGLELGGARRGDDAPARPWRLSAFASHFKTNRGDADDALGWHVELLRRFGSFAASIGWLEEGNDDLVRRHGALAQAWWVLPIADRWEISVGAGPYVAWERSEPRLLGLVSVELGLELYPDLGIETSLRFSRIVSSTDTDRDVLELGLGKMF